MFKIFKVFSIIIFVFTASFAQKPDINWFADNTNADTFYIANADQLAGLAGLVNNTAGIGQAVNFKGKTIVLTDNIDLSKYGVNYNNKKGWIPIGRNHTVAFCGNFDGNSKTVGGLYIRGEEMSMTHLGLFGYISSCDEKNSLMNLGVTGVNITGRSISYSDGVGGIVGSFHGTDITNCFTSGIINASSPVGGIVGIFSENSGSMTNCRSTATINSKRRNAGGVVGQFGFGNMSNCYSTGMVSGKNIVGGVVGIIESGHISNSYYMGTVSGDTTVGGVVGSIKGADDEGISNCYSVGIVKGRYIVGGIVGNVSVTPLMSKNSFAIVNSYSISTVSGTSDYVGGIAGLVLNGKIANNAALNPSVKTTGTLFGRMMGNDISHVPLLNNVAFNGMTNNTGNTLWLNKTVTEKNGGDITREQITADGILGGRFTTENGWTVENGKLPGIGMAVDMPKHLQ